MRLPCFHNLNNCCQIYVNVLATKILECVPPIMFGSALVYQVEVRLKRWTTYYHNDNLLALNIFHLTFLYFQNLEFLLALFTLNGSIEWPLGRHHIESKHKCYTKAFEHLKTNHWSYVFKGVCNPYLILILLFFSFMSFSHAKYTLCGTQIYSKPCFNIDIYESSTKHAYDTTKKRIFSHNQSILMLATEEHESANKERSKVCKVKECNRAA